MQKMGPLPLLIQMMWKPLRPQDELWTRSSISQYQVGWKRKEAGTRFGSVRGPANERPGRGMAVVAFLAGPAFPCLAMPGAHPTPSHHTTPQVKWRHACHSYPPPTPPLVLLSQPIKYRSFVFPWKVCFQTWAEKNKIIHVRHLPLCHQTFFLSIPNPKALTL